MLSYALRDKQVYVHGQVDAATRGPPG